MRAARPRRLGEAFNRAHLEAQAVGQRTRARRLEHLLRTIDADRLARPEALVQHARQLAGAAPEIDDAHAGRGMNQREQIVERLLPLALELVVLARIPGVDRGHGSKKTTTVYTDWIVSHGEYGLN